MAVWHRKSRRKHTGAIRKEHSKKKRRERGREFIPTIIKERKIKIKRGRGGNKKIILLSDMYANISVGNETRKAKIISVIENKANPNLVRQNIITKGCIIETEIGKAKVTSRPGQHGIINAVLIEEKK